MNNIHLRYNNARILLVDDEPLVLDMFDAVLRAEGFEVVTALSSDEACNLLSKESFDVLLCDIWLDTMDGFAVARFARERLSSIGVALVTGRPSEKDEELAESLGYQYLSKPVPFDILRESVFKAIESNSEFCKKVIAEGAVSKTSNISS